MPSTACISEAKKIKSLICSETCTKHITQLPDHREGIKLVCEQVDRKEQKT